MGYPAVYWPRAFDYGAFLLIGLLGLWARERKLGVKIGAALATPFLFFLISNFAVWLFGLNLVNAPYAKTFSGLMECYAAALPFLRACIVIGDWAFMVMFALTAVFVRQFSAARPRVVASEVHA